MRVEPTALRLCTFLYYYKGRTISSSPIIHRRVWRVVSTGSPYATSLGIILYASGTGFHRYSQILIPNYFGTGPYSSLMCNRYTSPRSILYHKIYIMWFVYILECSDGTLYTGISNNVEKRFVQHRNGKGGYYTRSHKPVRIVYKEKLNSKNLALKREYEIKKLTREGKRNLIRSVYMNVS